MVSSLQIEHAIRKYVALFPAEEAGLIRVTQALNAAADLRSRKSFAGHITCSGIVLAPSNAIILIKHRSLEKWLFPGGHLEDTDPSLRHAALREVREEVGLDAPAVTDLFLSDPECPIDIDRHTIPANLAKREPTHEHWDFRYTFRIVGSPEFKLSQEVSDLKQAPLNQCAPRIRDRILQMLGEMSDGSAGKGDSR
jgi:8-oxo-dGTP pyrophosphatase MutT (NUDIX family)